MDPSVGLRGSIQPPRDDGKVLRGVSHRSIRTQRKTGSASQVVWPSFRSPHDVERCDNTERTTFQSTSKTFASNTFLRERRVDTAKPRGGTPLLKDEREQSSAQNKTGKWRRD